MLLYSFGQIQSSQYIPHYIDTNFLHNSQLKFRWKVDYLQNNIFQGWCECNGTKWRANDENEIHYNKHIFTAAERNRRHLLTYRSLTVFLSARELLNQSRYFWRVDESTVVWQVNTEFYWCEAFLRWANQCTRYTTVQNKECSLLQLLAQIDTCSNFSSETSFLHGLVEDAVVSFSLLISYENIGNMFISRLIAVSRLSGQTFQNFRHVQRTEESLSFMSKIPNNLSLTGWRPLWTTSQLLRNNEKRENIKKGVDEGAQGEFSFTADMKSRWVLLSITSSFSS